MEEEIERLRALLQEKDQEIARLRNYMEQLQDRLCLEVEHNRERSREAT
jgi:hypothetical protein